MNYPIWQVPASGLLIAFVAIIHVYIAHFAVGGGLFLVLTERKARREGDQALLGYLKTHSRFFILLTLVLGALTGVGIWFTIGLVHPPATSSLINTFVWGWAIEWTLFVTEIAAAIVYYYGWTRLSPRLHVFVGWIYALTAWLSLVVINGILSYMLTPGAWLKTRSFWDGFLNPTYASSLAARTIGAMGIAGLYALLTASWVGDAALKRKLARWAGLNWVIPMAVALPLALVWYLAAADGAGVPVASILGGSGQGMGAILEALSSGAEASGYPPARRGALVTLVSSLLVVLLTVGILSFRRGSYGRPATILLVLLGLVAMGGAEWVREDLRKPYVIGRYMFVNAVRLPASSFVPRPPPGLEVRLEDRFSVDALNANGVLAASLWARVPEAFGQGAGQLPPQEWADVAADAGREVFSLLCSSCHTVDGHLALRPLVKGKSAGGLESMLGRLARPVDPDGREAGWEHPELRLETWRGRRMPPFVGTPEERRALAIYLARLGGDADAGVEEVRPPAAAEEIGAGAELFDDECSVCHAEDSDWPIGPRLRDRNAEELYELLGRLEEVNEEMPPFEGSDQERRALAVYLARLGGATDAGGEDVRPPVAAEEIGAGAELFDDECSVCHAEDSDWPIGPRLHERSAEELYELLGRLEEVNEEMPPFEGSDQERRALAVYLARLAAGQEALP